jgi:hypothetical protein
MKHDVTWLGERLEYKLYTLWVHRIVHINHGYKFRVCMIHCAISVFTCILWLLGCENRYGERIAIIPKRWKDGTAA